MTIQVRKRAGQELLELRVVHGQPGAQVTVPIGQGVAAPQDFKGAVIFMPLRFVSLGICGVRLMLQLPSVVHVCLLSYFLEPSCSHSASDYGGLVGEVVLVFQLLKGELSGICSLSGEADALTQDGQARTAA